MLLAALIPISESIKATGGADLLAGPLALFLGPLPPFLAVATLIIVGMAVTPFLNNAATVLIVAPIAAAVATKLGVNPDAYLMAVAVGAACDLSTPIGRRPVQHPCHGPRRLSLRRLLASGIAAVGHCCRSRNTADRPGLVRAIAATACGASAYVRQNHQSRQDAGVREPKTAAERL